MNLHRTFRAALFASAIAAQASRSTADPSRLVPQAGYDYGDLETARTLAMGGAARALGSANSAIFSNPANMAMSRVYHFEALAHVWPEPSRQTYGASAVDSMTSRVAVGVGGAYGVLDPDGLDRKWTDVRLALAMPFSDKIAAGVTGRYLKLNEDGTSRFSLPTSYASGGLSGQPIVDAFSLDAGITVRPVEGLALGVVGTNLSNPNNGFSPTAFGGGIGYGNGDFSLEGDVAFDTNSFLKTSGAARTTARVMLGGEYLAGDHFPLRVGYRYDAGLKTHELSGGLGYVDTQFGLHFALRRAVSGPDWSSPFTALVFELEYYIEGSGAVRATEGTLD